MPEPPTPRESVYGAARQGLRTRLAERFARRARERRAGLFRRLIDPRPGERIVDVGCGEAGLAAHLGGNEITGVDLVERPGYAGPNRRFVRADARELPFADGEFEIAYSNSLIEHVGGPRDRERVAAELRRVGRRYFVQTPNRWFPVEPHSLLPLVHLLPRRMGRRLWRFGVSDDPFEDTWLLVARDLRKLFPDALIVRERVGPLTKSLVAAGPKEALATRRRAPGPRPGPSSAGS
ncbi:MAG TPA: methyltransferase domain-containing protein [Thermoleophilaceae bacterium]|nr:methyltransferase domain-containing protein [Thermoleophilaceae bacterium]